MIYIENTCTEPAYNLALEEFLFTQTDFKEPVLLLWRNAPAVIIGRYQNTLEEVDEAYARKRGIRVVRRNTGGGAVYHDLGNLNYSFLIPDVDRMQADFRTFTAPVVKALRASGIDAEQTGRNDILAGGRKFSGNAQQFSRGRLLHHGTLMFDVDSEEMAAVLRVKPGKMRSKATKSVRSRVTNLKPLFLEAAAARLAEGSGADSMQEASARIGFGGAVGTGKPVTTVLEFKQLLVDWFDREYGLQRLALTPGQQAQIKALQESKYESDDWNFGRSPKSEISRGDFFPCGEVRFHFSIEEHVIRQVQITGDFFARRDIAELEQQLEGIPYDRESVGKVLREAALTEYLGEISPEDLTRVIV